MTPFRSHGYDDMFAPETTEGIGEKFKVTATDPKAKRMVRAAHRSSRSLVKDEPDFADALRRRSESAWPFAAGFAC